MPPPLLAMLPVSVLLVICRLAGVPKTRTGDPAAAVAARHVAIRVLFVILKRAELKIPPPRLAAWPRRMLCVSVSVPRFRIRHPHLEGLPGSPLQGEPVQGEGPRGGHVQEAE